MNVIYDIALIKISATHTQRVEVPRWEIPVLRVIHGNDVTIVGQIIIDRAAPDPAAEFQRLATRYGPKNEKVPAVAAFYGNFGPGTTALRAEIINSLTSAAAAPDNYKSPKERKLEAEQAASDGGQTLEAEAQAIEDAAAAQVPAAEQVAVAEQVVVAPDSIDEDIASLING